MSRVYNFSAGPAVLPEEVLKEAAAEMLDYNGTGMSVSLDGNLIRLVRNGNDFDFSCTKAADLYQLDDDIGYEETYRIISHAGGNQNPDQVPSNVVQASASA